MLDNGIRDIVSKLDMMCYLNIMSFSVLSGNGIRVAPDLHDLDTIEELCCGMPPNQMPYNISFMSSLYKSGTPVYAKEVENPYDFDGYLWIDKNRKRAFELPVLACSIINCCSLAEKILTCRIELENPTFIAFLLVRTAQHQARFIKEHLKVGNIYYSGEETAVESEKGSCVQIAAKEPNLYSQLLVMQAYAAIKHISSFNIPFIQMETDEFDEDLDLLPHLYENILGHMNEIKSRDLINIGLSIIGIYVQNHMLDRNEYTLLDNIASELMKRQNESGIIARTTEDIEGSSVRTAFNCLNFLSQLYYMFGHNPYLQASLGIYASLDVLWDQKREMIKLKDKNKQSYSIKDISAIISALLSFYCIAPDAKLLDKATVQIRSFYDKAFAKSQIFTAQERPILQQAMLKLDHNMEAAVGKAPVFHKDFEYKISKDKYYCETDVFKADYVLSSCCILLNNISSCYI